MNDVGEPCEGKPHARFEAAAGGNAPTMPSPTGSLGGMSVARLPPTLLLRDLRGHVRRDQHDALGAIIRSIFTAPDAGEARRRLRDAVCQLERRLPKIAALLEDAEPDVLAFYAFPAEHWPKLRSTNPLERFNREIGRRTDVVGIFPDDASLIRLVSMLAIEANDEWLVGRSYISQKSMATLSDRVVEKDLSLDQDKEVELIAA
jgi:putative transposase